MGKKILTLALCLGAGIVIVVFLPVFFHTFSFVKVEGKQAEEVGLFAQKVDSVSASPQKIYKLYENGELIGILNDRSGLDRHLKKIYQERYAEDFPNTHVDLGEDVYLSNEESYCQYTNADAAIFAYLDENDLYTVEANRISFAKDGRVKAQIYVKNAQDYQQAMKDYLSLFIDPKTVEKLNRGEKIPDLTAYGSQDVGVSIDQTITIDRADARPAEILKTRKQILDYLEYGGSAAREYYTVQKGDTVAGVGAKNHGLSATQVMNINRDLIKSTDQELKPGEKLCVTYFASPLDITVYRQRLKEETVYYGIAYSNDNTLLTGQAEIRQKGTDGSRNAMYTEKWVNGVLVSGKLESSVVTRQPVNEVVATGTGGASAIGTGQYRLPTDNPAISCAWGCYYGHDGTDFTDTYQAFGSVYAADTGTIVRSGYDEVNGNYLEIDHNNGWHSFYGNLREPSPLKEGTVVQKGQAVGHIGMSGEAKGPHVHFYLINQGKKKDACRINGFPSCNDLKP